VGTARCLLKTKGVPNEFWGEAVTTAVHLLNCAPTKSVRGATPHEAWHGVKPAVSHFRTFGCIAHVKITRPGLKKLDDCSLRTVFIGYEHGTSKAWRVYDPIGKRVIITRWSSHYKSVKSLLKLFGASVLVLSVENDRSVPWNSRGDTEGALKFLVTFDFVFILRLMEKNMQITDVLCVKLQNKIFGYCKCIGYCF
jgi:hypothetical protein